MKKDKSSDQELNPIKLLRRVSWILGAWPFSDDHFSTFRTIIVILLQMSMVICVTREIFMGCSNADEVIDLLVLQQCGTIAALKVILVRYYRKNVSEIITLIGEDWSIIKEAQFFTIMKSYASIGNFVFNAEVIFLSSELSLLIFGNLLANFLSTPTSNSSEIVFERAFPQGTKCLFMNISTTTYTFVYILQAIQCISTSLGNIGMDLFFFLLSMHICGQLDILCEKICQIEGQNFVEIKRKIVTLSQRHQQLLSKAKDLEETFSSILMLQLVINITGISLFGIQVIVNFRESGFFAALKPISGIEVLMIQLFLYCYAGDLLSSRIQIISLASYESLWYEFPKKLSKDIYFIMIKAGKSFALTAGNLFPMNLITFSSILKISVSYFSVLRLMIDAKYITK